MTLINLVPTGPKDLIGLSKAELFTEIQELGEAAFRGNQIWHWIYNKGVREFSEMSNISKNLQEKFAEHFYIGRPTTSKDYQSIDGSRKWLLKFKDGQEVETVHIPEDGRGALCVSSQVGCTLTCKFCHTGTQKLVRNLAANEIVGQLMLARDSLGEWPSTREGRLISNIVMMGMGEPLFNYENVAKAILIMLDGDGISLSRRKITLSTSGVVPMIKRCGEELRVNLAVSLHAVTDELRNELVPLNKKYPIHMLLDACRTYPAGSNTNRITFEYVMLKGVNDSLADARELVRLIKNIPAKINLIPFNPWPGSVYECSSDETIAKFAAIVNKAGYASPVRTPRGRDINAACGQLKSESIREARQKAV